MKRLKTFSELNESKGAARFNSFSKINEAIEQYDFEFKTLVAAGDVDITVAHSEDSYINSNDMEIHWEMDFVNRKYGIDSMLPIIKDITGTYVVITTRDDKDDELELPVSISPDEGWTFKCQAPNDYEFGYALAPRSIELDFKTKKAEILF